MKRVFCLLLAALLALGSLCASAEKYSSEPEKLLLQFQKGSGLKGTLSVNASGTADWAVKLAAMNNNVLQLRFLDERAGGFQYRIYAETDEGMVCTTEAVGDGTTAYITSDFLMGKTYTLPASEGLISALLDMYAGKPSWYSLVSAIASVRSSEWTAEWEPQLALFEAALESWMAPYLMPETVTGSGETLIISHYTIPAEDVKAELNVLLESLMRNSELLYLLTDQATSSQVSLYLQPEYLLWYQQIIDAMPMEGSVVLERTQTVMGEVQGYSLSFPLGSNVYGLTEVLIENASGETEYTLIFSDKTLYLSAMVNDDVTSGTFRLIRREGQSLSVSYTLTASSNTYTDSQSRNHEDSDYVLSAEPDLSHLDPLSDERAAYVDFDAFTAHLTASFYSKSSDTTPVTSAISFDMDLDGSSLQIALTLKSASPWRLPEAPEGPYTDLSSMDADQYAALLNDWFTNGLMALSLLQPAADAEEAEEPATPTDSEETDKAPAAEGSEEPGEAQENQLTGEAGTAEEQPATEE